MIGGGERKMKSNPLYVVLFETLLVLVVAMNVTSPEQFVSIIPDLVVFCGCLGFMTFIVLAWVEG